MKGETIGMIVGIVLAVVVAVVVVLLLVFAKVIVKKKRRKTVWLICTWQKKKLTARHLSDYKM